jgi:hypothetical protein
MYVKYILTGAGVRRIDCVEQSSHAVGRARTPPEKPPKLLRRASEIGRASWVYAANQEILIEQRSIVR